MLLKKMILQYLINLLTSLKAIHDGAMPMQLKASFKMGVLVSVPTFIIEQVTNWSIENYDYIVFVLASIAIDHFLGTLKHAFWTRDFCMKKNIIGICIKIGLVVLVGFLFEGLGIIVKHDTPIKDYLITVTRLMVFLYPAGSAFGNSSVISGGKFPPQGWITKLKSFQANLNPNEFKNKNDE